MEDKSKPCLKKKKMLWDLMHQGSWALDTHSSPGRSSARPWPHCLFIYDMPGVDVIISVNSHFQFAQIRNQDVLHCNRVEAIFTCTVDVFGRCAFYAENFYFADYGYLESTRLPVQARATQSFYIYIFQHVIIRQTSNIIVHSGMMSIWGWGRSFSDGLK